MSNTNNFMNKSRTKSDELTITCGSSSELLNQARVEALDGTAQAIMKIRRQYELAAGCEDEYLNQIEDAASSAEDAMFYLASAASEDDDRKLSEILASYGLETISGDSASGK